MNSIKNSNNSSYLLGCKKVLTSGIGLILVFSLVMLGAYLILRGIGAFLIIADPLEPAKAIIVLSGGTESRMEEALRLYNDDYGDIIMLTETGEHLEDIDFLHSLDMQIQLTNNGVPSGNIIVTEIEVNSTIDEARAVRELMRNRQYSSAIVVTDPYHTKRTSMVFRDVFAESNINLSIRPVRNSWFNSRSWFLSMRGWQFTMLEYVKIIGYQLGLEAR